MVEFKPTTTTEAFLGKIAGMYDGTMPQVHTRLQLILQKIAENSGNANFDSDDIAAIKALAEEAIERIERLESGSIAPEDIDALF